MTEQASVEEVVRLAREAFDESEVERTGCIQECIAAWGESEWHRRFDPLPESFGLCEAMDRAHMLLSTWSDFVQEHPTVVLTPKAYCLARIAAAFMAECYSELGQSMYPPALKDKQNA